MSDEKSKEKPQPPKRPQPDRDLRDPRKIERPPADERDTTYRPGRKI